MSSKALTAVPRKALSASQWASIVDLYERGLRNQRQLGEDFGVSSQAIHKGLKKRGALKGSRVDENASLIALKRELALKFRAEQKRRAAYDKRMTERFVERNAFMAAFMDMIIEADQRGDLAGVKPLVDEVRRTLR